MLSAASEQTTVLWKHPFSRRNSDPTVGSTIYSAAVVANLAAEVHLVTEADLAADATGRGAALLIDQSDAGIGAHVVYGSNLPRPVLLNLALFSHLAALVYNLALNADPHFSETHRARCHVPETRPLSHSRGRLQITFCR